MAAIFCIPTHFVATPLDIFCIPTQFVGDTLSGATPGIEYPFCTFLMNVFLHLFVFDFMSLSV